MLLGQIFNSVKAWGKLSSVAMQPLTAYKVLKYTKLVEAEYAVAEKQRVALIREITGTVDGQDAKIESDSGEFIEYVRRLNDVMLVESTLEQLDCEFAYVLKAIRGKDDLFTVQDLALLEPFFSDADCDEKPIREKVSERANPCDCDKREKE